MELKQEDFNKIRELEESMWRAETRYDLKYMREVLSPEFFEFGRSGRKYNIEETLSSPKQEINILLPLKDFKVHIISEEVFLITYLSEISGKELLKSNRSSLWKKTESGWRLMFHQGTPVNE